MSHWIAMNGLHILLFSFCLASSGLANPATPLLAYQDTRGQYSFGYSDPGSSRSEIRTSNGETRGTYSYKDDAGVVQIVHYVADGKNGFQIVATNLPEAPLPVQNVLLTQGWKLETEKTKQEAFKIGDGNVFLKGLQSSERKGADSNEKNKLQGNLDQGAKEGVKLGENEDSAGKLNAASQGEAQSGSSQNENSQGSILLSDKTTVEGLKSLIPAFGISEGNVLVHPSWSKLLINNQGLSLTPSSTLKIGQDAAKQQEKLSKEQLAEQLDKEQGRPQPGYKPVNLSEVFVKPVTIIRPNPIVSHLTRYTIDPTIHYFIYNN
ncbi:unnamed protein product [Xylocopa violacea]|uniref:Cuticle protein 6 n=1 Tax=Xylocopa violacea TaxID=135666 RepID=A0ABP1NNM2_XYLVO